MNSQIVEQEQISMISNYLGNNWEQYDTQLEFLTLAFKFNDTHQQINTSLLDKLLTIIGIKKELPPHYVNINELNCLIKSCNLHANHYIIGGVGHIIAIYKIV